MANTSHYGLKKVGAADDFSDDNFRYSTTDRDTIDAELYRHATHHHTGADSAVDPPAAAPTLTLTSTVGNLLPNTRYYYKHTWVDAYGTESLESPEAFIDTAPQIVAPDAPTVTTFPSGGTLYGGNYYYVLTAYDPDSTHETLAENSTYISVPTGSTNVNTVTFPALPDGAHGFNVYSQQPGGTGFFFVAAVNMLVATPPTEFVDDGSVAQDCDRTLPLTNLTNLDQSIQVCIGGATPAIPSGYLWRIYRTAVSGNYSSSLLHTVDDSSLCYEDIGADTVAGAPPMQASLAAPDKVQLTDAAEVQGTLPPAQIVFQRVVEFSFPGTLQVRTGTFAWRCPYDEAKIRYVVTSLGRSGSGVSAPASTSVIVDVNKYDANAATPSWASIFGGATPATRPTIVVGGHVSQEASPIVTTLLKGDLLTADIDQVGSGATPTDSDLLIQIWLWYKDSTASSIDFS